MSAVLLEVRNLKKHFHVTEGALHAVDGVNLSIKEGRTLGVVGESGCGKSTLGLTVIKLHEPTSGQIFFNGNNISHYNKKQMRTVRQDMQMIFQDPYSSLNPQMNVQELIAEPIIINRMYNSKAETYKRVDELLDTVGLAKRLSGAYPHELDGGRRQRIGVARALSLNPKLIICDEPVSALDVSIQAQILNLLMDLQEEQQLTFMFITHDLSVVRHISTEIAVMYRGKCIELSPSKELFKNPYHPYTQALLSAVLVPTVEARYKEIQTIRGEVESPINPPSGCRFFERCPKASASCKDEDIPLREITPGHFVACNFV